MWKHQKPTNLLTRSVLLFVLSAHLLETARALSDKRLCADEHCKTLISIGTGKINYRAGEKGMISFSIDSPIRIFSKGAGSKPTIWGIEVKGQRGYAPKQFIRETKVLVGEKNLKYIVDVESEAEVPDLSTSEKSVEQITTSQAATTEPLNLTSTRSLEHPLNNISNEKVNAENLPEATPVLSEIVDGTKLPISSDEQKPQGKVQKEVKETDELKTEIKLQPEGNKSGEEMPGFSSQPIANDEPSISEENKQQVKNVHDMQENDSKKDSIGEAEKTKDATSSEAPNVDIGIPVGGDYIPGNANSFSSSDFAAIDQVANKLDDVKSEEIYQDTKLTAETPKGTIISEATNVVSDITIEKYSSANINLSDDKDTTAQGQNGNNLQSNLDNEQIPAINENLESELVLNDIKEKEEIKMEINSVYKNTNDNANSSQIPAGHELSNNNNDNMDNDFDNAQIDMTLTSEMNDINKLIPEKEEPIQPTSNKLPIEQVNALSETLASSVGETKPSDKELNLKKSDLTNSATNSPQENLETPSVESQNKDETIENKNLFPETEEPIQQVSNKDPIVQINVFNETVTNSTNFLPIEEMKTFENELNLTNLDLTNSATNSSQEDVETLSVESQNKDETIVNTFETKVANETVTTTAETDLNADNHLGNIKADSSINSERHAGESSSSLIDYNNSTNFHNQQEINNKVSEEVPLQQSKDETVKETDNINSSPTESFPHYNEATKIELDTTEYATEAGIEGTERLSDNSASLNSDESNTNAVYQTLEEMPSQAKFVENINPTTSNPIDDIPLNTHLTSYEEDVTTSVPPNDNHGQYFEHSQENLGSIGSENTIPKMTVNVNDQPDKMKTENIKVATPSDILEPKENTGLFATIIETVNNMLTNNRKKQNEYEEDNELNRILFSNGHGQKTNEETTFPYCKHIGPNGDCPASSESLDHSTISYSHHPASEPLLASDLTIEVFLATLASKILEMSQLIAFLAIAAAASLFFIFGYYCFCNSSREGALLLKLNQLESSLLASHKENAILKHNLMSTRQKLASIENNSFGSNDMVVSLKRELEEELLEKARLQEQINVLQKELENAADAGIELNKIVSELLSNQTGDESIISSVEELQKQLNEQQNTIYEINASLAEKSRENSELQLIIAERNARYEAELANVRRDNDELQHEKGNLLTRLEEMKTDFDNDITAALEGKNMEIKRLQNDILELNNKLENEHTKWQTSVAKIEALEECLKNVRKDPKVNISEIIDVANVKAQLIEGQRMYKSLKERFETELDSRKLVENQLEIVSAEVEKLKQDFNQSEKDKLEAQTRLEVLSNYFKDKENQLQKELSLKEAMWLKQQGETTTTVDRVTAMQEEIQSLKSQNDSLRAEIEAQLAAHKAQIGTLENRAHETWLAARQSDRRYEEARAESTALRRKLTALAGGNITESIKPSTGPAALPDELVQQAPSPIHMEPPGSPMIGRMPPPPPFLPPPFMGPPPPFMGMPPPPPFVPPGEMRPAPLGRIMSPPPQRSGRFSPQHLDYEDYLDFEGNNTWHRYTYSPPPRTYRSLSPSDSRYNYGTERDLMSTYDTETDFSPPPSPRESRRRTGNSSERIDSNTNISYGNTKKFNSSSSKGPLSSGSDNSFNTHLHNDTKTKKGNAAAGGKSLV